MAIAEAAAWKETEFEPPATVTLAGTERLELLLARTIAAPPVGAEPLSVAVQEAVPGVLRLEGEQAKPEIVTGATTVLVIVPPLPVRGRSNPDAEVAMGPVTSIVALETPGARTTFTVATGPLAIAEEFIPNTRQFVSPGAPLPQETVLPAVVAAVPDVTLTDAIPAAE